MKVILYVSADFKAKFENRQ